MEAAGRWFAMGVLVIGVLLAAEDRSASAQNARSRNFLVHAPTQALAETVARQAEQFRDDLAVYWLGNPLPPWPTPCPIEVVAGPHLAAQGATTYNRSPVGNFQMRVIGSEERILDSVLPHEVTHTVMATHFGQPLPRWADEGICTTVEHAAERNKHEIKLREYLSNRRGIAMNDLFLLTEYPHDMLPMYAQGYSVCRFLIEQSGPRQFIGFLEDYMAHRSWTANVQEHYGYDSLRQLQEHWLAWVAAGSGSVDTFVSTGIGRRDPDAAIALAAPAGAPGLASPVRPLSPPPTSPALTSPALTSPPPTSLAGWYQSRRDQTATEQIGFVAPGNGLAAGNGLARQPAPTVSAANATGTGEFLGPPSVSRSGFYSVSQPQAELHYGDSVQSFEVPRSASLYR